MPSIPYNVNGIKNLTYLFLAVLAFYYIGKNGGASDFLSELNADDVLPALKLLGVNENQLNSALLVLHDLLSGDAKPADLIKKAAPLIISLAAKNKASEKNSTAEQPSEEGFKPVENFIPSDLKNELSAFFK